MLPIENCRMRAHNFGQREAEMDGSEMDMPADPQTACNVLI